jgi:hypothetical protein
LVVVSQLSAVHGSASAQSPSARQQSATAVVAAHLPVAVSHESVVQTSLSSQSASDLQQPAVDVTVQVFFEVLQATVVHLAALVQSAFAWQQSETGSALQV